MKTTWLAFWKNPAPQPALRRLRRSAAIACIQACWFPRQLCWTTPAPLTPAALIDDLWLRGADRHVPSDTGLNIFKLLSSGWQNLMGRDRSAAPPSAPAVEEHGPDSEEQKLYIQRSLRGSQQCGATFQDPSARLAAGTTAKVCGLQGKTSGRPVRASRSEVIRWR